MKKGLIVAFIIGAVLICVAIILLPFKVLDIITTYEPFTFEKVLSDQELREKYGIMDKSEPSDYGFPSEEINISSLYDSLKLSAWYVENDSDIHRTIVFVHGRTSNRLKTMKYLDLIKETGLDTLYNVLIPDLRNSGNSEEGLTSMGYKFSEDLTSYLVYLKEMEKQDTLVLYGFSMGAMAVMTAFNRPDLKASLDKHQIVIDRLVFDSPLCNVYETLSGNANEMGLPQVIFDQTFELLDKETDEFTSKMRMSYLLNNIPQPLLIFQSKADKTTLYEIFQSEIGKTARKDIEIHRYDSVDHVQIFQNEKYKEDYMRIAGEFIRKGN